MKKAMNDTQSLLDALAARDADIERLTKEKRNLLARALIAELKRDLGCPDLTELRGEAREYRCRAEKAEAEIERLTKERDLAQANAEDYDRDCIDFRYQRDAAEAKVVAAGQVIERLTRQNAALAEAIDRTIASFSQRARERAMEADLLPKGSYRHISFKQRSEIWNNAANELRAALSALDAPTQAQPDASAAPTAKSE